jgi:putative transposase
MRRPNGMRTDRVARGDLLRKAGNDPAEFLQLALERVLQDLRAAGVAARMGADCDARTPERTTQRNGHRDRDWETRLGTVPRQIPQLRQGSYFPRFLEPRRRSEQALTAVIPEASVLGVSPRQGDERVHALGMTGLSPSSVSALCQGLDERVEAFRNRTLTGSFPSVGLDAKVPERARGRPGAPHGVGDRDRGQCPGGPRSPRRRRGPREDADCWTPCLRG